MTPTDITDDPRNRFSNGEEAKTCANKQTEKTGRPWLVAEAINTWPRFSVVEIPAVGDEVSYSFNGDTYPDGTIVRVSKNLTVTTSTGNRYYRKGNTATWKQTGGTWSLIRGHISERNPSF